MAKSKIVCKFGGSSNTCWDDVLKKKKIIENNPKRNIIVVSAHGKKAGDSFEKDTDVLERLANGDDIKLKEELMSKAKKIYPKVSQNLFEELSANLTKRIESTLSKKQRRDEIVSFGEYMCAKLTSAALGYEFIDAIDFMKLSNDFGNGKVLPESYDLIRKKLSGDGPFVVPGFYGAGPNGEIITMSRGGSDLTGAIIAVALNAEIYENFTDVSGILTADPKIIKNPNKISEMTFEEIRSLAYSGFNVFHEEAMIPLDKASVPVHLRSTFDFPNEGTYIVKDRIIDISKPVVGIAYKNGFCSFDISSFGLNSQKGAARDLLNVFANHNISIEHIITGVDNLSIIFRESELGDNLNNTKVIFRDLKNVIKEGSKIKLQKNLGSVVVAGSGMKGYRGVSAKIQLALANAGINLKFISQCPSETSIIYGVDSSDGKKAVRVVYKNQIE